MATHILTKDRQTVWEVDSDNDTWILAENAKIKVQNDYAINDYYHTGTTVKVLGDIRVSGSGISAVLLEADGSRLVFGKSAHVNATGANSALQGNGDNLHVVNRGTIQGAVDGLYANNGGTFVNSGEISGARGISAFLQNGNGLLIRNEGQIDAGYQGIRAFGSSGQYSEVHNGKDGEIRAGDDGVYFGNGGNGKFVNFGLVEAQTAVKDFGGSVTVVNRGELIGNVDLGAGNDIVDLRRGHLEGTAYGGSGHDIYLVSSGKAQISEGFLEGIDLVRSSARFTLGANFENLELIGSQDVAGRGNSQANVINGNDGDNALFGKAGIDTLSGGAGRDILKGGEGADTFVFATGFGKDMIADFENGSDKIDLSEWAEVVNFADLSLNHMTVDGDDIVFSSGSDILRLKNVDASEIDSSDFMFV